MNRYELWQVNKRPAGVLCVGSKIRGIEYHDTEHTVVSIDPDGVWINIDSGRIRQDLTCACGCGRVVWELVQ